MISLQIYSCSILSKYNYLWREVVLPLFLLEQQTFFRLSFLSLYYSFGQRGGVWWWWWWSWSRLQPVICRIYSLWLEVLLCQRTQSSWPGSTNTDWRSCTQHTELKLFSFSSEAINMPRLVLSCSWENSSITRRFHPTL